MADIGRTLALVAVFIAAPCLAQLRGLSDSNITVYYQPRDETFARDALRDAVAALPTLETTLGIQQDERLGISMTIARAGREFDSYAGGKMLPWVQGVALPGRRIVLKPLGEPTMKRVVAHELTHVLLDTMADRYDVEPPRWLHEGLAKVAAGDVTEADRDVLGRAVVENRLLTLRQLEGAFAGKREAVDLAYAQSYTLVGFLAGQPRGGIAELLQNLGLTHDLGRALLRTYGKPEAQLQREWLQHVKRHYFRHGLPVPTELVILLVMGALFLIAHLVNRRRRRRIRARLQEEDRLRWKTQDGKRKTGDDSGVRAGDDPDELDGWYWE